MTDPERDHNVSRRALLGAAGLGTAAAIAGTGAARATGPADTAALPGRAPAQPGYYRIRVGDTLVTAVSDGTFDLDADELLLNVTPQQLHEQLTRSFVRSPVESSVNCYVVDTGRHRVLVDTGAGSYLGPGNGRFHDNLRRAGYAPDQLDAVVFTHLHQDHVGGLRHDGRAAFTGRHTRILAERTEAAYWLDPANEAKAPEASRVFFQNARESFAPYRGRLRTFRAGDEIVPGLRSQAVPGHTPGHVGFRVGSAGEELLVWGDVVHLAEVQFPDPGVAITFDSDPGLAVREREALFAEVARRRYPVAGAHLPFPGLGHVRAARSGYEFVPLDYTTQLGDQA